MRDILGAGAVCLPGSIAGHVSVQSSQTVAR